MKVFLNLLAVFILINFVTVTKEELCGDDKISISPLGKCETISDFLEKEDLTIKTENLIFLASNEEGKIEKGDYKFEIYKLNDTKLQSHNMRKSKIYIPNSCLEKMETNDNIKLNRNKGIVVLVYNSQERNQNNIADKYFIIRHNSEGSNKKLINSKTFDLSFCHKDPILFEDEESIDDLRYSETDTEPIDINTILYGRKFGIDLFDPYSDFLNDICFKFTSEKGTDVPMDSRREDYYQNITFCDDYENSHYLAYNYSSITKKITYRCAFGYYEDAKDKSGYLDIIDNELKNLVSVSNIKVITCYRKFLNLRDIITNYGGMICILVLLIQIVCFLIFCFSGIKPIEEKLENLFVLGASILKGLMNMVALNTEKDNLIDGKPKKKFNLWGTIRKIIQKKKEQKEKEEKEKKEKEEKEKNNEKNVELIDVNNPPKKRKSIKSRKSQNLENDANLIKINDINEAQDINHDDEAKTNNDNSQEKQNLDGKEKRNSKKTKTVKFANAETTPGNNAQKEKEKDKVTEDNEDDKKSKKTQIYDYENDELNELPFKKARKYDKRGFCKYYWNILMFSHIILNVFFRHNDYNLFTVKLGLLFMTFPINLTFNIFFYTNKNIKLNYQQALNDLSGFWSNIANTVYSSLLSSTLLIMLKFICLTHNSVRVLRKFRDVEFARKKSICVLRCIKVRVAIYYILSFAFLSVFGYYVLCFCAIFENTQIQLVKSTLTSWLISLIYPLIICFITSIFRALAFKCNNRILYLIKTLMQFL